MLGKNWASVRFAITLTLFTSAVISMADTKGNIAPQKKAAAQVALSRLPLALEPNQGQASKEVRFMANGAGYSLFLTHDEAVFVFNGNEKQVLRMRVGAPTGKVAGMDRLAGSTDYFLGNDPTKWVTNVPQYSKVAMGSVAKGVDLYFYGNAGRLEYDYVLAPGADPKPIAIALSGARALRVNQDGDLVISLTHGDVQFKKPFAYQIIDGKRRQVAAEYAISEKTIRFKLGKYDRNLPLTIDPVFNYLTYIGGMNSAAATAVALDSGGLAYVVGNTSTTSFPVKANDCTTAATCGVLGGQDVFVARVSANGEAIQKLSIIGGSGADGATSIAVGSGSPTTAYVGGLTASTDFPTVNAYQGTNGGGLDGFVFALPPAGTALAYSTYIGGSGVDIVWGVAFNASRLYVTGSTETPGLFSTSAATQFQGLKGTSDAWLAKFDPMVSGTGGLLYATYFGGTSTDSANGIAVPTADTVYLVGTTASTDLTTSTLTGTPYSNALSGTSDALLAKFDTHAPLALDGANPPKCTTGGTDLITVTTTANHNLQVGQWVIISGVGNSTTAIVFNGAHQITSTPTTKKFTYVDSACHGAPSSTNNDVGDVTASSKAAPSLLYSTYVGGSGSEDGRAIAVNAAGNAFIAGNTDSPNAATFPDDTNPIQSTGFGGGASDAFVAQVNANATAINYSAYLGGAGADGANAIAVDPTCAASCEVWIAGYTQSSATAVFDGPTAFGAGAGTPNLNGGRDGFVVRVNGTGNGITFGSYVGGGGAGVVDVINGAALNASQNSLYVAGSTDSSDLPVNAAAAQNLAPFSSTGFVARISGFNGSDPGFSFTNHPPSADPLVSGNSVTYTWDVANTSSASNITFDLPMPNDGSGHDFISVTTATPNCAIRVGSASTGPGGVTCQLVNQAGVGTQSVTVTGTLNAAVAACVTKPCASFNLTPKVASAESEGSGNPVTATATTGHVGQAITLDVTGTTANSNVSGGANYKDTKDTSITFTLNVTNPAADATDVNINVSMVYPTNFVVDTPGAGCTDSSGTHTITCNVGTIGSGATASTTVIGHYSTVAAPATLVHTLTATPATTSSTQVFVADNAKNQNVAFNVNYLGPTADLAVTNPLTITAGPVHVGSPISIQAFYTNKAGSDLTTTTTLTFNFDQAFLASPLPAGCTQASAGANVICALGGLAAGASGSVTLTGNAPLANSAGSAPMNVNATITATGATVISPADDTAAASIGVIRNVALSVSNFAVTPNTSIHRTQSVTYSVDVTNAGPDPATNINTVFTLTAGYTNFVPVSGGCVATNATTVTCTNAGPLASGASQTNISFTVTPSPTLIPATSPSAAMTASVAVSTSAANIDTGATPSAGPLNTTVERRTDLSITSFNASPGPIGQNGTVTYTAIVQNNDVNDAVNIRLHFSLPANYVINAGGTSAACNVNVTTTGRDCDTATLVAGGTATYTVQLSPVSGTVPTTSPSASINASVSIDAAQVAIGNLDGGSGTKTAGPVSTVVERRSNLGMTTFTVSPTPNANDGVPLTYTINGNNAAGSDMAEGVQVVINFTASGASGFTLGSTTLPGGCTTSGATQITCSVGQVAPSGSFSFTVQITPPAGFLAGTASKAFTANATISGQVVDGTPGNNNINNLSVNIQAQADLFINMIASNSGGVGISQTNLNTQFKYTINIGEKATVSGGGSPTPATNARVSFTLPNATGRTFTASSINAGNFTCLVGGVPPTFPIAPGTTVNCVLSTTLTPGGATEQLEFVGTVDLPALQKTNTLPATATVDTVGPTVAETSSADNTTNLSVILNRDADLSIGVIHYTPQTGGTLDGTYIEGTHTFVVLDIPVSNAGPDPISSANQVTLASATLPAGTTFNAANSNPSCSFASLVVTCTNVAVTNGGSTTISVALTPPSVTSANGNFTTTWNVNTGAGAGTYNDNNSANNNANSTVTIQRQGNVGVAIAPVIAAPGYVVAGPNFNQNVTYTVTVSATSPGANAANVPVSVVLPSGTTGITTTIVAPNTCTPAGNTVNCNIQTLNAGTSVSFNVSGVPLLPATQSSDPGVTATASINPNALNLIDQSSADDSATSAGIPLRGETDLQITVTSPPTPVPNRSRPSNAVAANDDLVYTINVLASNAPGMHPVEGLRIDHVIPPGTTLVSVNSPGLGCTAMPCSAAGLATGSPQTITVRVTVPAGAVPTQPTTLGYQVIGTGFNQPTIALNNTETAANNNNNNLTPSGAGTFNSVAEQTSDMAVSIPVAPGLLQPGNTAHFTIQIDNVSSLNPSTGTTVTIPIGASPVSNSSVASATPSQGSCGALSGGGTAGASITCNLGSIAVGGAATIDFAITPALPGQVTITPAVSVANVDPNASNNGASATLLTGNTPAGSPVTINPAHPTTGATNNEIAITFGSVAPPGGNTTAISYAAKGQPAPALPSGSSGFQYVNSPTGVQLAYDVNTTATYGGAILCFNVGGPILKPERVRVYAAGTDITVPTGYNVTAAGGVVCGNPGGTIFNPGTVVFQVVAPMNSAPTASATNTSSSTTGKGLTGAGVKLVASNSADDSNLCVVSASGTPTAATCRDIERALLTWTGQFTDGNQKQVQCTGTGGVTDPAAVPPKAAYPACLSLDVSVPFGQQNITLQITDPYGSTSTVVSTQVNSTGSASGSTSGSVTINAGQSATYTVNATGGGGVTTVSVVSITPSTNTITCSVTPNSFTGTGTPSLSVGCSTQAPIFAKTDPVSSGTDEVPMLAGAIGITALPLFGMLLLPGRSQRQKRMKVLAILGLVMLVTLFMGACGGGGKGSNFGGSATLQSSGTPKGTYTVTLGASGGGFCDSTGTNCTTTRSLTLVVQ